MPGSRHRFRRWHNGARNQATPIKHDRGLQRAVDLKPCVFFIDEADALIANRAGSWSAAATNTFLSETGDDRASLRDVLLIAATNHPDLIDPALLRPGRLDKSLYCGIPNEQERLDILYALSRKLTLHPDCDLAYVAKMTEYYTG